jgi:hypothetical protein
MRRGTISGSPFGVRPHHRLEGGAAHAQNGHLGEVDDGGEVPAPHGTGVGDGKRAALEFFQTGLPLPRPRHQALKINRQFPDALAVHIAQDRYDQTPGGIHGNAHMEVLLVDDLLARPCPGWH